jgi:hypothetical protein
MGNEMNRVLEKMMKESDGKKLNVERSKRLK